ncbi:MAG: hypothetical protein ACYTEK_01230 [Planctomycetota bacterium]|jgi:hypothetical protein
MKWLNCAKIRLVWVVFVVAIVLSGGSAYADFTFGEPTNLGPTINSPGADDPDSFSSDGLSLFLTSNRTSGPQKDDLYVSSRATTGDAWGTPVKLGPTVNSSTLDGCAAISTDGLSLYFTSIRAGGHGGFDIWVTTRGTIDDEWAESSNLGPTVNGPQDDIPASVSFDGLLLYLYSDRPGGFGGRDLWVSTRQTKDSAWGEPVNLGPTVNSSYSDGYPCISADGLLLFFYSDRPGGFGDRDLYMTRRTTIDDDWGIPVNLGPAINTSAYDVSPTILPDGSALFFSSTRPGGVGYRDLWQAAILPIVDFNGDGQVDGKDVLCMVGHWDTNDPMCDIGPFAWGDGIVDLQDLIVLAEYIGKEVTDPTLIAHWKLDETEGHAAMESVSGGEDVVMGSPLWQPAGGMVDGAIQLDGVDDHIVAGPALNPADAAFSITAWIRGGAPGQVRQFDDGA